MSQMYDDMEPGITRCRKDTIQLKRGSKHTRNGVSQAQVARMEKRGYDAYTLNSLRRYVQAIGEGFSLDIAVRWKRPQQASL